MDQGTTLKRTKKGVSKMFWWILLGIWGLGMIWFIFELITAPEMEDHC